MIAFEVHHNGKKLCLAGVEAGVLSTVLAWVGRRSKGDSEVAESALTLNVGGLEAWGDDVGQQLRWLHDQLQVGDSVLIRIVEVPVADPPASREPKDPALAEELERTQYERLREKYASQPD